MTKPTYRAPFVVLAMCLAVLVVSAAPLAAQESPHRRIPVERGSARWVADSLAEYHVKVQWWLDELPYGVATPEEMRWLTVIDTLSKSSPYHEFDQWLAELDDDTLRFLCATVERLHDRAPLRFRQAVYPSATDLQYTDRQRGLSTVYNAFKKEYWARFMEGRGDAERARSGLCLEADHILHIRVHRIEQITTPARSGQPRISFAVFANVIDTLKGRKFDDPIKEASQFLAPLAKHRTVVATGTTVATGPQIVFNWRMWPTMRTGISANSRVPLRDRGLVDERGILRVDQELIVFLRYMDRLVDDDHDYFVLSTTGRYRNSVYRIDGHDVIDPDATWGETRSPLPSFKRRIQNVIREMTGE